MKKYGLNELREMFLSFFESKGHLRLPSFSLVPQNDASLLLINSGMAPMKPWFTGEQEPPRHRICTCQKCIRTGDIENIGKTDRHGTFFEMLGNFSFGDYFKKEAIAWCWEFLTEVVGLPEDRLYPSVYVDDDEAFEIWNRDIGISPERIFKFGKEDNFWEHGAGPCGPCSEVYYDRGEKYGCGKPDCTVGCDCDRFIEVWNNVFTQFNSDGHGNYTELSQKNIDTGMGLERLAVICQDVKSLFDVDTVMNITNKVSEIAGVKYGDSEKSDVSLRVITDHLRAAAMMACDGVLPSNEGRGYVLRRLLRRAARHAKLLGVSDTLLWKVCDTIIEESGGAYPELIEKRDFITRVIKTEEENFSKTIDQGMRILHELIKSYMAKNVTRLTGEDAFKLYDTYGFPIDLTFEILEESGMSADTENFTKLMEEQRERARKARTELGDLAWAGADIGVDTGETEFLGYDVFDSDAKILAIAADGEERIKIGAGDSAVIVLDKTPFYAEMGGQSADHGVIRKNGAEFEVQNVLKNTNGAYLHYGSVSSGEFSPGDSVRAEIDAGRRRAIMRAHTSTHLLQKALKTVLGDHVHQAGSFVEPDRLRFDFTHFQALTGEEINEIERIINSVVLDDLDISIMELPLEQAKKMGAEALFGEKYGETVRVIKIDDFSLEFCGGTHLQNTAKAGQFKIISESSIAAGVRRIEASVGFETLKLLNTDERRLNHIASLLKLNNTVDLEQKMGQYLDELRELRRAVESYKAKEATGEAERILFSAKTLHGLKVITAALPGANAERLRKIGDFLRERESKIVAVLAAVNDGKITFLAVCGQEAVKMGIKAGDLIKKVTKITGGSGGGKPDSAMGGGRDPLKLDDALACVDDFIVEMLGDD
jgi:alanyl-tRNA synthetase